MTSYPWKQKNLPIKKQKFLRDCKHDKYCIVLLYLYRTACTIPGTACTVLYSLYLYCNACSLQRTCPVPLQHCTTVMYYLYFTFEYDTTYCPSFSSSRLFQDLSFYKNLHWYTWKHIYSRRIFRDGYFASLTLMTMGSIHLIRKMGSNTCFIICTLHIQFRHRSGG